MSRMHRFLRLGMATCVGVWGFSAPAALAQSAYDAAQAQNRSEREAVKSYVRSHPGAFQKALSDPLPGKPEVTFPPSLSKILGQADRKSVLMNGNKIKTEVTNYGGIGPGYGLIRGVSNLVWRNLDYIFQFGPIVGASVPNALNTIPLHIISDGLWDYPSYREVAPGGTTLWQWQPLPGYADPNQVNMASNPAADKDGDGKPDSWPQTWYNPTLGKYVWPGYLQQDVTSADLEVYWAMDDRDNVEFPYYPFPGDSTRRGIGLQVDGRGFQWSNALAENTIFFVYSITNVSEKRVDTAFFGIYGDPDLGGNLSGENSDDNGYFIPPYDTTGAVDLIPVYSRSLVYFWDPDMKGARSLPLGYLGCKFLESPGNPLNGIDDDGDGLIDERQDDGIDNDGDWSRAGDDNGIDGIPNTNDAGEGDGVPTAGLKLPDGSLDPLHPGELNFELTDLDEADQIGLTSFNSWTWSADAISNDESMWARSVPRNFGAIQQNQDIVFIFGSGYISLEPAETKRVSMALLCGENLDDLLTSAKTVQTIYNNNYRFFKPPVTPHLTTVPGDQKVTLFWDTAAEESVDPLTGKDFEGYVIYRSTDPDFADIQTVTDGRGAGFLNAPLRGLDGTECKWDVDRRDEPFTDLNGNLVYDLGEPFRDVTGDGYWTPGKDEPFVDTNHNGAYDDGEPFTDRSRDGKWTRGFGDVWKGYHPVPYEDRGVHYYLGNNSGLVHSFVDSNKVINGQTYYYAVVAYDHGDSVGIPVTESTKKIALDPITSELTFDVNTAQVIPGPRTAAYVAPQIGSRELVHAAGRSTAQVQFTILNDLAVRDDGRYRMTFADSFTVAGRRFVGKNYTVLDLIPITETVTFFDTNFATLRVRNIVEDSALVVRDPGGTVTYVNGADYVLLGARGLIRRVSGSRIPATGSAKITYRYTPVFESRELLGADNNSVFDGIRLSVADESIMDYSPARSGWIQGKTNFQYTGKVPATGGRKNPRPIDLQVHFSDHPIDSAFAQPAGSVVKIPVKYQVFDVTSGIPQRCLTFLLQVVAATRNQQWDPGEEIIAFRAGATTVTDTVTWGIVITPPADTVANPPILPTSGDILFVGTSRPLAAGDMYTLSTTAGSVDLVTAADALGNIYVVPNPYVGYSSIEPPNRLADQSRGERRVYFENLPQRCTIRIYTMNGDPVQTLEHDSGVSNGREFWNLLNRDGFGVAYGIYLAHIDAPGIGETIIKLALIK